MYRVLLCVVGAVGLCAADADAERFVVETIAIIAVVARSTATMIIAACSPLGIIAMPIAQAASKSISRRAR